MFIKANKGKYWRNMSEMLGSFELCLWRTEIKMAESSLEDQLEEGICRLGVKITT